MNWLDLLKRAANTVLGTPSSVQGQTTIPVGTGADNERQFYVDGIPHLLRDEGERIAHFSASFEPRLRPTPYGEKLLPDVVPCWEHVRNHSGTTLDKVAAGVMYAEGRSETGPVAAPSNPAARRAEQQRTERPNVAGSGHRDDAHRASRARRPDERLASNTTIGNLLEWGEMEFPNRKPHGAPTYTSFAVKVSTASGVQTLQGEGLKDAIAKAKCNLGDRVVVKRLHKEKVLAFDQKTGRPILDRATGEQKLWDKWVWSINLVH